MIKAFNKVLVLSLLVISSIACSNDESPSNIDLLTAHTWKLDKYLRNGTDETAQILISNFTEQFTINGVLIRNYIDRDGAPFNESGAWQFDNNEEQINVTGVSSVELTDETTTVSSSDYNIIRLNDVEFRYSYDNGGDSHEFRFIPN